jgi:hypothetical protein
MTRATNFLERILDPLVECMNSETALGIVTLSFDPELQARIALLAERANEGALTPEERAEYVRYVEASDILATFKLEAERRLDVEDEK